MPSCTRPAWLPKTQDPSDAAVYCLNQFQRYPECTSDEDDELQGMGFGNTIEVEEDIHAELICEALRDICKIRAGAHSFEAKAFTLVVSAFMDEAMRDRLASLGADAERILEGSPRAVQLISD